MRLEETGRLSKMAIGRERALIWEISYIRQ